MTGLVTSNKGGKTIVITVSIRKTHPIYKKQYSVNTKFMAHDDKNQAEVGDLVSIVETKPLSARKRFRLDKIIERGGARFEEADATADIPEEEAVDTDVEQSIKRSNPKAKTPEKEEK